MKYNIKILISYLIIILGIYFGFTFNNGFCFGDTVLNTLGLKSWTGNGTGFHITAVYSFIIVSIGIWVVSRVINKSFKSIYGNMLFYVLVGFFIFSLIGNFVYRERTTNSSYITNEVKSDITIKREELTDKEKFMVNSTGIYHNYLYKIEGISKNKNYKLICWSEEYKKGKLDNKEDILKFYINENNNVDSSLYVALNIQDNPNNTLGVSIGTLSDVPNSIVVAKKEDAHFMEGVSSSLNGIDTRLNQEIPILSFSKAYDSGMDTSIDLDNVSAIEKGIKENDMVRIIKIKLVED